jgi:iron complex outermembrane receptor protein
MSSGPFRRLGKEVAMRTTQLVAVLLATTAVPLNAFAQTAAPDTKAKPKPAAAPAVQIEQVVVTASGTHRTAGGGLLTAETASQSIQTISMSAVAQQTPTSSPVTLIQTLPSVNITATDAFGLNGGANVQMHGLPSTDIGFLLDGMPVYNSGASYSNETIDAEDLQSVSVAPGTSQIDSPTVSSAAGTIYITMRDPAKTQGGEVSFGVGSDALNREYVRLETGLIGDSGVRAMVSFSHTSADNFRGAGTTDKKHMDLKLIKDFTNGSRLTFEGSFTSEYYAYYFYPTAAQFANYHENYANFNVNAHYTGIDDTAFYTLNEQTPFNVFALQAPAHIVLNDNISIEERPYVWIALGAGNAGSVLTQGSTFQGTQPVNVDLSDGGRIPLTDGQALVNTGYHFLTIQSGNVLETKIKLHNNDVTLGWWYENYNQSEMDPVGYVNQATGSVPDIYNESSIYKLADGANYYSNHSNQYYQTNSLFVADNLSFLNDKLKIGVGFRDVMVTQYDTNLLPGAQYKTGFSTNQPLPQVSAHYQIDPDNSVYVDGEADFRLPYTSQILAGYSVGSGQPYVVDSSPKPETAIKEELGYRYQGDNILADVSLFNINLTDRLLTLNTYQNGNPVASTLNAGGQTSRGVDAQLASRPLWGVLSPYASFEYLHATIDTNTAVIDENGNPDYLPTAGKTQVQSPKVQGALGLTFATGPFSASARLRFVGSQYATLMDDEKMPGFVTNDLSFSYQIPNIAGVPGPKLQANLINVSNAIFRDGVYAFQYNARPTTGTRGGPIAASGSPAYYVAPAFAAIFSLSERF